METYNICYTSHTYSSDRTVLQCDTCKSSNLHPRSPDFIKGDYNPDPKPADDMMKMYKNPVIESDYKYYRNGPKPPKKLDDDTAEFI